MPSSKNSQSQNTKLTSWVSNHTPQAALKKNRITLEGKQKKSHKLFPKNESETFSAQCRHWFLRTQMPFDAFRGYAPLLYKQRLSRKAINWNNAFHFLVEFCLSLSWTGALLQDRDGSPWVPKSSMGVPVLAELHSRVSEASSLGTRGLCAPWSLSTSQLPCIACWEHTRELDRSRVKLLEEASRPTATALLYQVPTLQKAIWAQGSKVVLSRSSWTDYSRTLRSFCSSYPQAIPPSTAGADVGQDLVHNAQVLKCHMFLIQLVSNATSYVEGLMVVPCKEWHVEAVERVIFTLKLSRPASKFLNYIVKHTSHFAACCHLISTVQNLS